jgi:hypothetical protein
MIEGSGHVLVPFARLAIDPICRQAAADPANVDPWIATNPFGNLGQAEVESGDIEAGARHAREFLRDGWEKGVSQDWSLALVVEAQVRLGSGDVVSATALWSGHGA